MFMVNQLGGGGARRRKPKVELIDTTTLNMVAEDFNIPFTYPGGYEPHSERRIFACIADRRNPEFAQGNPEPVYFSNGSSTILATEHIYARDGDGDEFEHGCGIFSAIVPTNDYDIVQVNYERTVNYITMVVFEVRYIESGTAKDTASNVNANDTTARGVNLTVEAGDIAIVYGMATSPASFDNWSQGTVIGNDSDFIYASAIYDEITSGGSETYTYTAGAVAELGVVGAVFR